MNSIEAKSLSFLNRDFGGAADSAESASTSMTEFTDITELAEWISTPETVDAAKQRKQDSDLFDASLRALNRRRRRDNSIPELKLVEFCVELPDAKIVQLVADFTGWEEAPLDMIRFDRGIWSTTVPLPAGVYAYRYLVDGEWYDDPRAVRKDPRSAGSTKAFVKVK